MPPAVIDLTGLSPNDGFVIQGSSRYDGAFVSDAGDINGDGIDDFIVSAPGGDQESANMGESYIIYGQPGNTRGRIDLNQLTPSQGFVIQGDGEGDRAAVVSAAGDVNGDGIDDIVIGAPGAYDGGAYTGEAYVIYGRTGTRGRLDLSNITANDGYLIRGLNPYNRTGTSVSGAGDFNGDGLNDVIVSLPRSGSRYDEGRIYVVFGQTGATRSVIDLENLAPADGFYIEGSRNNFLIGRSISNAGDINGDGIDDIVIGGNLGSNAEGRSVGHAYVIYGKAEATRPNLSLASLTPADGFVIIGASDRAGLGASVSNAGDVNGDGIDDIVVGAYRESGGGAAYVIYGQAGTTRGDLLVAALTPAEGFVMLGAQNDFAGIAVGGGGDFNGDGFDDVIVGARYADFGGANAGGAYIVFGGAGTSAAPVSLAALAASQGLVVGGDLTSDWAGEVVSFAGDVNADGIDDILIASPGSDDAGINAGESAVIYGRLEAGAIGGTRTNDFLTGTVAADAIYGLAGNDLLYGDIGNDRLFGADGSDALFGQAGDDILSGGADSDKLDGGADNDIVNGGADGDSMRGGDGDDVLDGGAGSDAMNGGTGIDIFTGGEGRDKFRFRDGDTGNSIATADRITDLDQAQGERVSLTLMDAIVGGADDAFTFIGTGAFGNVAGQLRYELIGGNTYVMGDTDGDGASDFMIRLDGALVLTGADFSL